MSSPAQRGEMSEEQLFDLIRTALPRLLREHPEFRHEVAGILAEVFPTRQEFGEMLAEIRALREDFSRHAEETARRFEAVDRRFEELIRETRGIRLEVATLSGRLGYGLEHIVQGVIEEFSGETFSRVERLILTDDAGELYGVPGAQVEFDLLLSNGTAYVVEVKSHLKAGDVLTFHRKAEFATRQLGRPLKKFMIAASMEERAEALMQRLGIEFIVRTRVV